MFLEHPYPQLPAKHPTFFVPALPSGLPVDLLAIQYQVITKQVKRIEQQALTIGDAETALDSLDKEYGAVLKLAQRLGDRLAVFAPNEPVLKDLEQFLENGIDSTDC